MLSIIKRLTLAVVLPAALVVGCGGGAKKQDPTTHTNSSPAGQYRAGESCNSNQAMAYSTQGFVCKNGKLQHKSHQSVPATTTHAHTTTSAPQGY